jgi:hypothetical protein
LLQHPRLTEKDNEFDLLQESIQSNQFYKYATSELLNYTCRATGKTHVRLNHEAQEYQWLPLAAALKLKLNKPTKILVEAVRKLKTKKSKSKT